MASMPSLQGTLSHNSGKFGGIARFPHGDGFGNACPDVKIPPVMGIVIAMEPATEAIPCVPTSDIQYKGTFIPSDSRDFRSAPISLRCSPRSGPLGAMPPPLHPQPFTSAPIFPFNDSTNHLGAPCGATRLEKSRYIHSMVIRTRCASKLLPYTFPFVFGTNR